MYVGNYDPLLVLFSIIVAILASYTALDMAGRISMASARTARWWLAGGSLAMGAGIWSMHFIGMLAFRLPIPLGYDPAITAASLVVAIASSAYALWLVSRETLQARRLAVGALVMGCGVAAMHYIGMGALRMQPGIRYEPAVFALSIAIAVGASGAALWLVSRLRRRVASAIALRAGAAVLMGFAIACMHYTGMAAADFPLGSVCGAVGTGVTSAWLAPVVIVGTVSILTVTILLSVLDLRHASHTARLAASLAEANQELTYLALHDNLTRLPNRMLLGDRLDQAIERTDRTGVGFALMFMDLDGFKAVNDAYGHCIGDKLLIDVAKRTLAAVRPQDTLARVGGDEFAVVAEIDEAADAAALSDTLVHAIRAPYTIDGMELRVSTSIGIAVYPNDGKTPEELLSNADAAMYHAKSTGRNASCFFEESMNANVRAHLQLMQDLRHAIERRELVLYYQPKVIAPSGPVTGAEALLRWNHPARGLIPPDQFIPLAEKNGQIIPIGAWVLDEACRQLREWHDAGHASWSIAVNLSAVQFAHAELVDTVQDALTRHRLAPRCLTLEITESTAMRDVEASLLVLQKLRQIGVHIAIDDFGTGYSSLLYLKRLPADELKIDRGFVRGLASDAEDVAIVSSIIALGQTLDFSIVAEGVETADQQATLTDLGCDSLQGYLLGHPAPAERFLDTVSHFGAPPPPEPADEPAALPVAADSAE
ncbi:Uncharacterized signaling protein PA1727 [Burkholderia multivorans]